jgi:5-methylcytosine-specific restriction endonuclease McrA
VKHSVHIKEIEASDYANLVLLNRTYSILEKKRWNKSRISFLRAELEKCGKLTCCYCGRNDLEINSRLNQNKATVDHIKAKSNGGNEFDHSNFAVSCMTCNSHKGNGEFDDFINSRYIELRKRQIDRLR